jgi:hypothetical protein
MAQEKNGGLLQAEENFRVGARLENNLFGGVGRVRITAVGANA